MANADPAADDPQAAEPKPSYREIRYQISRDFVGILEHLGATLLISTYQAGKLVVVGQEHGQLALSLYNFERAMGLAVHPRRIAVGAEGQIWLLQSAPDLAARVDPAGRYDACFLTRSSHVTGEIHVHEMAWAGDELWFINTLFSCLCTLHDDYSFVPRWRPPFVSAIAAEERCHLNGFVLADGKPKYATALAETDTPQGWRPNKATSGCVIDVPTGVTIARGFCMPHSPRIHLGNVWVLDSGKGRLTVLDTVTGHAEPVTQLPGYTRGLAFHGRFAFVGLSKVRETSTFGGVPIAERRDELRCGVGVVEVPTGRQVAYLEFQEGVDEIFDVQVMPAVRFPVMSGPFPKADDTSTIWLVPTPEQVATRELTRRTR